MTTWTVYAHVGADQSVLYVGCTSNLDKRNAGHAHGSRWWSDVAEVQTVDNYPDRAAALNRERDLIEQLRPPNNIAYLGRHAPRVFADAPAPARVVEPPAPVLLTAEWLIVRTGVNLHALAASGETTECGMRLDWRRTWRNQFDPETPRCQLCEKHVLARGAGCGLWPVTDTKTAATK